jgi:hypothetical protein
MTDAPRPDLTAADWAAMRAKVGEVIATAISRCDVAGCDHSQPDRVCSSCLNLEQLERDHLALLDALARQQEANARLTAALADAERTLDTNTIELVREMKGHRRRADKAEAALADRDATIARLREELRDWRTVILNALLPEPPAAKEADRE